MSGWVKLHRDIVNWEWYKDLNTKSVFIHCLLRANITDSRFMGQEIKRGSFVTSIQNMAKETGLTSQKVRTSLDKLTQTGEVNKKVTNRFTIITVCKYESYQDVKTPHQQTVNKQITNKQQTDNKQLTTIKEYKELKELKKGEACASEAAHLTRGEILFKKLISDVQYREAVNRAIHLNGSFDTMLRSFITLIEATGKVNNSEKNIRAHFISWAKKQRTSNPQTATTTISFDEAAKKHEREFGFFNNR